MNRVIDVFKKDKNIVIGALHFPPLLGYPDFPGYERALADALADLIAFEEGGVDAVIFENNYDIPHVASVGPGSLACMTLLGSELRKATKLPLGVSVLWNDYRSALTLAKLLGLQFIRVPVFVDEVETAYGRMKGDPQAVIEYRKLIGAEEVQIFADIHVKHATLLSKYTLSESADLAIEQGADALIVTGRWTGDAPALQELIALHDHVKGFPIVAGSGLDESNVKAIFGYVNGAIVSTSLKEGDANPNEINLKSYDQRVSAGKVKDLVKEVGG